MAHHVFAFDDGSVGFKLGDLLRWWRARRGPISEAELVGRLRAAGYRPFNPARVDPATGELRVAALWRGPDAAT